MREDGRFYSCEKCPEHRHEEQQRKYRGDSEHSRARGEDDSHRDDLSEVRVLVVFLRGFVALVDLVAHVVLIDDRGLVEHGGVEDVDAFSVEDLAERD